MRAFGKYRLVDPIASGGMAEVWRAEAPGAAGFVKEVALKLIRGDHDARSDFVEMFIREARLASRLAHGNIVQVFDFDQVDGRYYIAMELVRGKTLRAVVDRCRALGLRFGLARAVHVATEVARALAYAHRAEHGGVVHRDVSPHNVLLSFEGEVKLADFGIARVLGASEVTAPGTVKGKLAYMAPEQARGGVVDARADVFSLGVILWELCTGRRLFARDSDAEMLAAVVAPDPIAPPSSWNESVPPELDAIVVGALSRDPAGRTASADELATALAAMRLRLASAPEDLDLRSLLARLWPDRALEVAATEPHHTQLRAHSPAPPTSPQVGADPGTDEAPTRTSAESARRRRTRRGVTAAIASAVVLGLIGGGIVASAGARLRTRFAASSPHAQSAAATSERMESEPTAPPGSPGSAAAVSTAAPPPRVETSPAPELEPSRADASRSEGARAVGTPAPAQAPPPPRGTVTPGPAPTTPRPTRRSEEAQPEGTGTLAVRVAPWAYVRIDGEDAGETPFEASLSTRPHRIEVHHPKLGDDEIVVTLRPGERFVWRPRLSTR